MLSVAGCGGGKLHRAAVVVGSRGEARIGRTLAINPGSEYSAGVLRGAIITLNRKKGVRGYQLVAG